MIKEELLQDWLPRLWGALIHVRAGSYADAEEDLYELYVEMKQQTLAEKLETFGEITLEDQLSAMALELLATQKRVADLELQICQRHFEANHIPDDTKMVSGVKDSLTTQQEQGELAATERQVEILTDELANCQRALEKQEQGEPVAWYVERFPIQGTLRWGTPSPPSKFTHGDSIRYLYTTPQQRKPLSAYINSAKINATDLPHIVVEKLEKAIEAAHGIKE
jgi:hypothetical protein